MKRFLCIVSSAVACAAILIIGARRAESGAADAIVRLQASTPGSQQVGHANLSGTMKAGIFSGSGSGLTGVPWGSITGAPSSFPPSGTAGGDLAGSFPNPTIALPYSASINMPGTAFKVVNSNAGTTYGFWGETSSPTGVGVAGYATGASGLSNGVIGQSNSSTGNGVLGYESSGSGVNYGVEGYAMSPGAAGVFGYDAAVTGNAFGVEGQSNSTAGTGVFGVNFSASGTNYGVFGQVSSPTGVAVDGHTLATTGLTIAVLGQNDSPTGRGVYGVSTTATGANYGVYGESSSSAGTGVLGFSSSATGTAYGVAGSANVTSGFGLYAFGRTGASGTKSFRIDHPFDPLNKYLLHYSSEGPEPLNVYRGTVKTDGRGFATVTLPDYFEEINIGPTYQLTVVDDSDDFVLAKVLSRKERGQFTIRTSKPNVEVDWRVEARRNDLFVQKYGAPVEIDKEGPERGKYQHPELYGAPAEMGMLNTPKLHMAQKIAAHP